MGAVWALMRSKAAGRAEERRGFERLVDHIVERRRRFPGMHVYHYAPYERTALSRLMGQHGTREQEVDELLRGEVLVDLFRVTKQALRASVSSYSIKDVEKLFGFERKAEVSGGSESVTAFETWLETEDDTLLDPIRDYNEEDCVSLYELHRWLLEQRPREMPWQLPPEERERSEEAEERDTERARVRDALLAGAEEGDPDWLLAHLLDYHQREERPQWWEYFFHRGLDDEELLTNRNTLGGLVPDGEPHKEKQSWWYPFRFEAQEHKIHGGGVDPRTERAFNVRVDDEHGTLDLRWGRDQADDPLPTALIPPQPLYAKAQRAALLRFAKNRERYPAAVEILERRPPRARLDGTLAEAALSLDGSYLFVQGPPGSGKTWSGARAALALMQAGRRVGVTALSHKAIHKFLDDLEEAAVEVGYEFRGRKKGGGEGHYENRSSTAPTQTTRCSTPIWNSSRGRPGFSRERSSTSTWTRFSSTRAGSSRSPTRSPSALRRGTSYCSATRTSSRRFRRGRTHRAPRPPCSATCSARTRRCGREWVSSWSRRGGCGRR